MVREMIPSDWTAVAEIYKQGINSGVSTFTTELPSYEEWDRVHLKECRLVYEENGKILGWVALTPTSYRAAYRGVVEVSIYVDYKNRGRGVGDALMQTLKEEAPKCGFWSLYSVVLAPNKVSYNFHKKMGFREIGYKERVAQDKFGQWQNVTLFEFRL